MARLGRYYEDDNIPWGDYVVYSDEGRMLRKFPDNELGRAQAEAYFHEVQQLDNQKRIISQNQEIINSQRINSQRVPRFPQPSGQILDPEYREWLQFKKETDPEFKKWKRQKELEEARIRVEQERARQEAERKREQERIERERIESERRRRQEEEEKRLAPIRAKQEAERAKKREEQERKIREEKARREREEQEQRKRTRNALVWSLGIIIIAGIVLLYNSIHPINPYTPHTPPQVSTEINYEQHVRNTVETLCDATVNNDYGKLAEVYANNVKRYHSVYDVTNADIVERYRNYDKKFGVYSKRADIRWNTLKIWKNANGYSVIYVEDYHINRDDKSKYTDFVLEKHIELDHNFKIVSEYDVQLSKSK